LSTTAKLYIIESDGVAEWLDPVVGSVEDNPTKGPLPILRSLIVEQDDALVVIEAGLSVFDSLAPRRRLRRFALRRAATLRTVRQRLEQRGLSPDRVTHVVATHLHRDSIGGISDFPLAQVHAWPGPETAHAMRSASVATPQLRYTDRCVVPHSELTHWYGFPAYRLSIDALDIQLIGLPGHTREHAGVAVRLQSGYAVHLGHALLSLDELLLPKLPANARQWARLLSDERPFEAITTRDKLRRLAQHPPTTLSLVSARGEDRLLSVGPGPHQTIEIL
jgi:glyoxylase-like metal-dependent hydrolase (beta-lactamase superfamily II)